MSDSLEAKEMSSVDRYDGTNFPLWKMHMTFLFQSKDLFEIVNGTSKKAEATDPAAWERKDKSAAVAILNAINKKHNEELSNCSTSNEMWKQLLAYHESKSEECIIALQEKVLSIQT
jgi:hypothetical protein